MLHAECFRCLQELARFVGNTYESQPRAERIRHLAEMLREELVDLLTVSLPLLGASHGVSASTVP